MEPSKLKVFFYQMIATTIVLLDERVGELNDRVQRACASKHRCIEIGVTDERESHGLSDQE